MNAKTQIMFNLSRMYEYVTDIDKLKQLNTQSPNERLAYKHSLNMCILQIGEYTNRINNIQEKDNLNIVDETYLPIKNIKGLRNRIAHSYDQLQLDIINQIVQEDIPQLKKYIEMTVNVKILQDPFQLYEKEYDDLLK